MCCTNKCIINERYIPEHQNKLNIYDLQNYEFLPTFFNRKKFVKFYVPLGRSPSTFTWMSADGQRSKLCRNIAENFNRLSRAHERYRQTTDRRTTDDI